MKAPAPCERSHQVLVQAACRLQRAWRRRQRCTKVLMGLERLQNRPCREVFSLLRPLEAASFKACEALSKPLASSQSEGGKQDLRSCARTGKEMPGKQ